MQEKPQITLTGTRNVSREKSCCWTISVHPCLNAETSPINQLTFSKYTTCLPVHFLFLSRYYLYSILSFSPHSAFDLIRFFPHLAQYLVFVSPFSFGFNSFYLLHLSTFFKYTALSTQFVCCRSFLASCSATAAGYFCLDEWTSR